MKDANRRHVFSRLDANQGDPIPRQYRLEVSQQPRASPIRSDVLPAARNPLPTCRLRLVANAPKGQPPPKRAKAKKSQQPDLHLQNPYLFCVATLCFADSKEAVDPTKDGRLKGHRVSSMVHLRDADPCDGDYSGFFVFPFMTVCLCAEGDFCFRLSVLELGESEVQLHAETYTDSFKMFEVKYAGKPSTSTLRGVVVAAPTLDSPPYYTTPFLDRIRRKRRPSRSSSSDATDIIPAAKRRVSDNIGRQSETPSPPLLLPLPTHMPATKRLNQSTDLHKYSLGVPTRLPPIRRKSSLSHSLVARFNQADEHDARLPQPVDLNKPVLPSLRVLFTQEVTHQTQNPTAPPPTHRAS